MLPCMSSDRLIAYRTFKGEVEKLKFVKDGQLTDEEKTVINYMERRMSDLEEKGHDDAFGKRDDINQYSQKAVKEEDLFDHSRRKEDGEVA